MHGHGGSYEIKNGERVPAGSAPTRGSAKKPAARAAKKNTGDAGKGE